MEVKNMGGGGSYYDRDTTPKAQIRKDVGFSAAAEKDLSRSGLDPSVFPGNRRLICNSKNPIVISFDKTGSMQRAPLISWDKAPMASRELSTQGYVEEPEVCISAIGDMGYDRAVIQVCEFAVPRLLGKEFKKIWLESNSGGGNATESYELMAYFFARRFDMPNAETPFFFFVGDEGFEEQLYASDIQRYIDGGHENTKSRTIFAELQQKFKGNVFLVNRNCLESYGMEADRRIVSQWESVLGKDKIIKVIPDEDIIETQKRGENSLQKVMVEGDRAIIDIVLGVIALTTGSRTLEEYLKDMEAREQTDARCALVKKALDPLVVSLNVTPKSKTQKPTVPEKTEEKTKPEDTSQPKKKKPGRL